MPTSSEVVIQNIPLDHIRPSRSQARKNFDPASLQALADSLLAEGLLQPIIVRPLPSSPVSVADAPAFELVAGERRWRAAQLLGWPAITALVIEPVSEGEAVAKGVLENLQREDLDPIEEAEGIQKLMNLQDSHWTQEKIAKIAGKSQSRISESLRFLELSGKIQENIRRRIILPAHAVELLRLPEKSREEVAEKIAAGLSTKATRAMVDRMVKPGNPPPKEAAVPAADPFAALWPRVLSAPEIKAAGALGITYRKEKWDFVVQATPFQSPADLAAWFKQLGEAIDRAAKPQTASPSDPESLAVKQTSPKSLELAAAPAGSQGDPGSISAVKPVAEPPLTPMTRGPMDDPADALTQGATQIATDLAKKLLGGLF